MDVDGTAERAAAGGVGRDGVWQARARDVVNAPAIMVRPKNRVRVIADFQDRGLTGLLALTGGTEHVFVIVLTSFVVRPEVSIWRLAGALPYQQHHSSGNKLSRPTRSYKGVNTYTRQGYHPITPAWIDFHFRPSDFGPQISTKGQETWVLGVEVGSNTAAVKLVVRTTSPALAGPSRLKRAVS